MTRIQNIDALYPLLADKFLVTTTAEWIAVLESHDMICAPVQDYEMLLDDPPALANEYLLTVEPPTTGPTPFVWFPVNFSVTPAAAEPAAPALGHDAADILHDLVYRWAHVCAPAGATAVRTRSSHT